MKIILPTPAWEAFLRLLERPATEKPRLRALLSGRKP